MGSIAVLVLLGWIPTCAMLFALLPPVRACIISFLGGWLLLPMASIHVQGLPDIDKVFATSAGVVIGTVLFQSNRFSGFRLGMADILVILFAGVTCITSLVNDLGPKDGVSVMLKQILWYAVPYIFGRVFIRTKAELLDACRLVVYASAIYAVFAVWEWRMSPQLHQKFYGFMQHSWNLTMRWGFYRPMVFFPSNLALGTFFAWTSVVAIWLYRSKLLPPFFGVPSVVIVGMCMLGLLTSMSFGPWGLAIVGFGMLLVWQKTNRRFVAVIPAILAFSWMVTRYTDVSDGSWMSSAIAQVSPERARSLQYRIRAETILLDHSKGEPWFGLGGWGRNRVTDAAGNDVMAADGLWIIYLTTYGIVGLAAFYFWWCYPLVRNLWQGRSTETDAALMAITIAVGLQATNFLFNAFLSPVLTVLAGAIMSRMESESYPGRVTRNQTYVPRHAIIR